MDAENLSTQKYEHHLAELESQEAQRKKAVQKKRLEDLIKDEERMQRRQTPTEQRRLANEYMKADAIQSLVEKRVKEEVEKRLSEISFTPKSTRSKASKGDEQE